MAKAAPMTSSTLHATTGRLTFRNRWDHFLARWAIRRYKHRVEPGLYALGDPNPESPVFVTANYTLSFDALRSSLDGMSAFILVLDTKAINVWCAAGKSTFGTDELVTRIAEIGLAKVVRHRTLILPQLGAPGVAAHEVKKRSGFTVEYGPIRVEDLPEYLKTHKATDEMRRKTFPLRERIVLIPVELVYGLLPLLAVIILRLWGAAAAILAGTVLFPILLPLLPSHNFSVKGFVLGGAIALPFALSAFLRHPESALWIRTLSAIAFMLVLPPITAYLALNFTGSTPYTSRTGVRREIFSYIPKMAWLFGSGLVLTAALFIFEKIRS
jgi:hypothetical protein